MNETVSLIIYLRGVQVPIGAVVPRDVSRSVITQWVNNQLQEFHAMTCSLTGVLIAFRVIDVAGMHEAIQQNNTPGTAPVYKSSYPQR